MKNLFAFIFFLSLAGISYAQTSIDFTGTYSINKSKIDFGQAPATILPVKYHLVQNGDKLNITTTSADDQGTETSYTESLLPGSNTETALPSGSKRSASITWNTDHITFTVNSNSISPDGTTGSKITAIWSIADDGKTLVIDRTVEQANGLKYSIKGYYDKK